MDKQQFSAVIKSIRDKMRKDPGLSTDVDRLPQLSWLLFLKCFDDLEKSRAVLDENYEETMEAPYRWRDWAANEAGKTGNELIQFVDNDLLPHLRGLVGSREFDQRDVIAAVFKETYNRMLNGYIIREVINLVNKIDFTSKDDIHTMAFFYETMLKEMRDAAGTNGEFYTPRPVIRFMVNQVNPQLGQKVYDPACGTGGFLIEAYKHMKKLVKTKEDYNRLQYHTLYGTDKKPMPYLLGMMNLLLHEIDRPNIVRANTLTTSIREITEKQRYHLILTNPPFGGEEEKTIQQNFPTETRTQETSLLFLQFIMRSLKTNGKCAIVLPDGPLFAGGVAAKIRKQLLKNFNLHTIIRLPPGVFAPYTGIPTNLLFFDKTVPTKKIWYYKLPLPKGRKTYTKTNPLRYEEFSECQKWWNNRRTTENSWRVSVDEIKERDYLLDIRNPNEIKEEQLLSPKELVKEILEKNNKIMRLWKDIEKVLEGSYE